MSNLTCYKYKIVEFTPDQNMEKTFNELGKNGWELVSVVPFCLKIEGRTDVTFDYEVGESSEVFEKVAAYFKKTV